MIDDDSNISKPMQKKVLRKKSCELSKFIDHIVGEERKKRINRGMK